MPKLKQIPHLPKKTFLRIAQQVPMVVVELFVVRRGKLLLIKRGIPPGVGTWHLPGGFIGFNEPFTHAIQRVARKEFGTQVKIKKFWGVHNYRRGDPRGNFLGLVHIVEPVGKIKLNKREGAAFDWFDHLPPRTMPWQRNLIRAVMGKRF